MSSKNHHYEYSKNVFILSRPKRGKREASLSSEVKDPVVNAGTLVDLESHSGDKYNFRTIDSSGSPIYVSCKHEDEFKYIDADVLLLLLPITSPKERLHVFNDKDLLSDGLYSTQVSSRVFVRVKDVHLPSEVEGIIQYKGPVDESNGIYFGVELKEGRGNSNGSLNGRQYFQTCQNGAVFVPLHKIRKSREDWQKYDRLRASEHPSNNDSLRVDNRNQPEDDIDLKIGDRIVWPSDNGYEGGTVAWIGILPDEPMGGQTIGVNFDNRVGSGTGKYKDHRLFYTQPGHASLIPPLGLMKEWDFRKTMGGTTSPLMNPIVSDQRSLLQQNRSLNQQYGASNHKVKADVNKSSLPAQFNHHTGFLEPVGTTNGMNHVMYEQGQLQGRASGLANRSPDPTLVVGTNVQVHVQAKTPFYGVIRWIGYTDANRTKLTAGLELEQEIPAGSDGVFNGMRYFHCSPKRALFIPLSKCVKDRRYAEENGGVISPEVTGDIPIPEICSNHDLRLVCGKNRGIQGHHNSCYLDSTLFCMFYFSNVFDSIFNRPPKENDLPEYPEVQKVLKDGIVNPLRKHNFVSSQKVWRLRVLLDKLGTVPGMMGEEKDVEEFLSALLTQIMKADPLLHLSTGEHTYFYQLFMEKDDALLLPTTQKLVELSFLQGNVKLKEVPACLMIQMPRFGKDYKMFRRIVPSLELDITDILENSPRDCIVCGDLATWECKKCYQVHGPGLNTTALCDKCKITSHKNVSRKHHTPEKISTSRYFPHFQQKKEEERKRNIQENTFYDQSDVIVPLPREKMELFAVICIQTSHYVSFVKCGPGIDAPWVFFDSMADRIGEQEGYNVPEVVHMPELATWLSESHIALLNKDDKDLPEHLRRILCDGYMCMYQSPDVMMFQ